MKKVVLILVVVVATFVFFLLITNKNKVNTSKEDIVNPTPLSVTSKEYSATFQIITNGTTRMFTNSKYHNQSEDVYISLDNPNLIHVKKDGITWSDFFKTLPMSLDKKCLITGTKQTFCTSETNKLFFYINSTETPDALDRVIGENDQLLVEYK